MRRDIPLVGILAAMSLALELFVHFPILAAAPYLLYSPGDLPIIVAAIVVGPWAGVACAFVNATLFVLFTGQGGPWGALMHFIASGGMAYAIGLVVRKTGNIYLSVPAGVIVRTALMIPMNLLVTPIYTGLPVKAILQMVVPVIIPFNLIHAGINTTLTCVVMKLLPSSALDRVQPKNPA